MFYKIRATIPDDDPNSVGCFDPTRVVIRIRDEVPGVTVCVHDYAWKDYDSFVSRSAYYGAIRVAENDARRRGPIYLFRVRTGTAQIVSGSVERYRIQLSSEQPIPEPINSQFLSLFQTLQLGSTTVRYIRQTGNDAEDV